MIVANWLAGWMGIGGSIISGAIIGLRFHQEDFWGGYNSFRRRLARLGHIALAALGMINILYSVAPPATYSAHASAFFIAGLVAMPAVCFLSAWRSSFRHLFPIPVVALAAAVTLTILGGLR